MTTMTGQRHERTADLSQPMFRAIRFADFVDLEFRADAAKREFEGIAVPWDKEIDVDGWAYEIWRAGAFDHQLRAARRVKAANGHIPLGGDLIGSLREMRNDAKGLFIRGKVTDGIKAGDEALALAADGSLDELSIGFYRVPNGDSVTRKADGRPLYEMRKANLFEVALVPFGAYGRDARITGMRQVPAQRDGRERIEVAGFRTVAISVDGVEVASYKIPAAGPVEAVVEPAATEPAVDSSIAALDAMIDELPELNIA